MMRDSWPHSSNEHTTIWGQTLLGNPRNPDDGWEDEGNEEPEENSFDEEEGLYGNEDEYDVYDEEEFDEDLYEDD